MADGSMNYGQGFIDGIFCLVIQVLGRRDAYPTRKNDYEWDGHLARPRYLYTRFNLFGFGSPLVLRIHILIW
jgi:hypothetical protein